MGNITIQVYDPQAGSSVSVVAVSSPTAAEGASLVFGIALSGTTQQVQLFPFTIAGTATASLDYATPLTFSNGVTISGTNLSMPIGISSFTASTLTSVDALVEPTETVIFTIGGITGTGSITNVPVSALTALTDIVAFELPYEMLTAAQRTATAGAASGGYFGVTASRNSTATVGYAAYLSTTPTGTFTKFLDNQTYAGSALLQGGYNYNHSNLSFIDEKDFPTAIAASTMALLADTAGQQEFVVLPGMPTPVSLAGDTGRTFEDVGIGAYYTKPISIYQDDTARLYFLNSAAKDTVLRANGTYWLKIVPKDASNVELDLALITAIPVSVNSMASRPNYATNIGFNFQGNSFIDPYVRQDDLPSGNTYVHVGYNNRTTTPPGSFYSPSATLESGVSYEMDIVGLNGVGVARTILWDSGNNYFFYNESDHLTDGGRYATDYIVYAVKGGIRSLGFPLTIRQQIPNQNQATTLTLSSASSIVTAAIALNTTTPQTAIARQERVLIAVTLSGTLLANIDMSTITPNANALLMSYNAATGIAVFECTGDTQNFNINIPYTTGSGKSLTVTAGGVDSVLTQTIAIP